MKYLLILFILFTHTVGNTDNYMRERVKSLDLKIIESWNCENKVKAYIYEGRMYGKLDIAGSVLKTWFRLYKYKSNQWTWGGESNQKVGFLFSIDAVNGKSFYHDFTYHQDGLDGYLLNEADNSLDGLNCFKIE